MAHTFWLQLKSHILGYSKRQEERKLADSDMRPEDAEAGCHEMESAELPELS